MKFDSLESLIKHVFGLNVPIQELDFEINSIVMPTNQPCDGNQECPIQSPQEPTNVKVAFNSFSNKPVMEFELADKSVLVVEEFSMIPNSCTTTKVKVSDREILIGVCEVDGVATAKFDVSIDGNVHLKNKSFILSTNPSDKNTISLND